MNIKVLVLGSDDSGKSVMKSYEVNVSSDEFAGGAHYRYAELKALDDGMGANEGAMFILDEDDLNELPDVDGLLDGFHERKDGVMSTVSFAVHSDGTVQAYRDDIEMSKDQVLLGMHKTKAKRQALSRGGPGDVIVFDQVTLPPLFRVKEHLRGSDIEISNNYEVA